MRHHVEAELPHLFDLILPGRHNQGHVHRLQPLDPVQQFLLLFEAQVVAPQRLLRPLSLCRPMLPHLVVHLQRRGLVNRHHHRFSLEAPSEKMSHHILGHSLQPVVACDDVVLPPEHLSQPVFLCFVERRVLDDIINILVERRIGELQFRRSILVKERHGRAILGRLLEIVNGNVIPEDFLRALFARDQWRAGKREK